MYFAFDQHHLFYERDGIMSSVGEYLLRILCVAILCGIVSEIMGKKGISSSLIRLLCGVFLVLSAVSPLTSITLSPLEHLAQGIYREAEDVVADGKQTAQQEYRTVITQKTEAYILDKAQSLGAEVTVRIFLEEGELAAPQSVAIHGRVSPYAKKVLSNWLTSELGIDAEEQTWSS